MCGDAKERAVAIVGVLADTHDQVARTRRAVDLLRLRGAEVLIHCGDLIGPEIVEICSVLPFYFVFGNHDADMTAILEEATAAHGATCLGWGGEDYAGAQADRGGAWAFDDGFAPADGGGAGLFAFGALA